MAIGIYKRTAKHLKHLEYARSKITMQSRIKQGISRMKLNLRGEKTPQWKGENASYEVIHQWLKRRYGSPFGCVECGTTENRKYEWANISGKYHRSIEDFQSMCVPCHRKMDFGNYCKRGHEFVGANLRYYNGHRICRICRQMHNDTKEHKEYMRLYRLKKK